MGTSSFSTSASSSINTGLVSRSAQKTANKADKTKQVQKRDIYPTDAVGQTTAYMIDPMVRNADFYRDGKPSSDGQGYEINPRTFIPMETTNSTASIRVFGKNAKGEVTDIIPAYSKFILNSVQEGHTERSQIIETFGDFYVFMFGERPPVYNFSGTLINSQSSNWVNDFMFLYDKYLRGTKCVERNANVIVTYGGRQIEGLILGMNTQTNDAVEGAVPLQFSVVVFERRYFSFSEDMGFYTDGADLVEDEKLKKTLSEIAGPEGTGTSDAEVSVAINQGSKVMAGEPAKGLQT